MSRTTPHERTTAPAILDAWEGLCTHGAADAMNGKLKKTFRVLRSPQRHTRSVAEKFEVYLPPVRWTPTLIDDVARLLADAIVRDLRDHPPEKHKIAS